jgi:predicted protein tyrosine phosphatase
MTAAKPDSRKNFPRKVLFICSRNKVRSLTAEKLCAGRRGYDVRSAGTQPDARIKVTEGLLGWADLIFMMEKSHLERVRRKYPEALQGKEVVVLHIPDEYEYMAPDLMDELTAKLSGYLEL